MKKAQFLTSIFLLVMLLYPFSIGLAKTQTEDVVEISAKEAGVSLALANKATAEKTTTIKGKGTLIEIGNTTAEITTIVIRVSSGSTTSDLTIQVNAATKIVSSGGNKSDLSNWITGDAVAFTAQKGTNSGELIAKRLQNLTFKTTQNGHNGWVQAIRASSNQMDIEWSGKIYTLNTSKAKMVAGSKNPATLDDFKVGDRVRTRLSEDNDGNNLTWNADMIVVLRRGDNMFMRITHFVVPAEITALPEATSSLPYVIRAKVLSSKYYQKGDVNNPIGAPGTEFNIEITDKTNVVRRYLGKASLSEFMEGDQLMVVGRFNETTKRLEAVMVKNNSIQALGVSNRLSQVTAVDRIAKTITIKPIARNDAANGYRSILENGTSWTLKIGDNTKIVKNGQAITFDQIIAGDILRVRGVASRTGKTIETKAISVVTDQYRPHLKL